MKQVPHPSHSLTKWVNEVRAPAGEPRFYDVRHCRRCMQEELRHPAGHFVEGLLSRCAVAPRKKHARSNRPSPRH